MIKKIKVYIAECDKCRAVYCYGDNDYDVFKTKKELIEMLTDENNIDTWKITKNKVLCDDCK